MQVLIFRVIIREKEGKKEREEFYEYFRKCRDACNGCLVDDCILKFEVFVNFC